MMTFKKTLGYKEIILLLIFSMINKNQIEIL